MRVFSYWRNYRRPGCAETNSDETRHTRPDPYRQRPPTHREPPRRRSQWPGDHLDLGDGGRTQVPGTHTHAPPFHAQVPSTHTNPGPGAIECGCLQRGGGMVGATNMVLGDKGVPRFPKFSCTDGWASVPTIPAAITQAAARANSFSFPIYPPNV